MQKQTAKRKLTTILYADIAGYSRLTGQDELDTHERVMSSLDYAANTIKAKGGRVLRYAGDAILAEFQSVVDCVNTSIEIQTHMHERNSSFDNSKKIEFRIGLNLGEVLEDRNEIFGEGVNIAARLEASADPGGVSISEIVHDQVKGKIDQQFLELGPKEFKNIAKPIQVYAWHPNSNSQDSNFRNYAFDQKSSTNTSALQRSLNLKFLDNFEIRTVQGERIELHNSKAEALIAYLALMPENKQNRKTLASLLWSRHDEEQARASLRQCLSHIKRKLSKVDEKLITSDRKSIGLNTDKVSNDITDLDYFSPKNGHSIPAGLIAWNGQLFVGLDGVDDTFDDWLQDQRLKTNNKIYQNVKPLFEGYLENKDLESAEPIAEVILKIEPTSEFVHRGLMQLFNEIGEPARAIEQYEVLAFRLQQLFGSSPSKVTRVLYEQILEKISKSNGVEVIPKLLSVSSKPVIAFCPIDVFGVNPDDFDQVNEFNYILNDQLSTNLAKFREFKVKEGGDILSDLKNSVSQKEIKDKHSVDYLLRLNLIVLKSNIKLNVRISSCESAMQLWGNSYNVEVEKMYIYLEDVVNEIVDATKYVLTYDLYEKPQQNLTAYDYWLKGSVMNYRWVKGSELESIDYFEKAIELDPNLSRAYSSLASVYNIANIITPGYKDDKADKKKAKALISKALEIDPLDARNHLNAGWGYLINKQFDPAEKHFRIAYGKNPNSHNIIVSYCLGMAQLGFANEVINLAENSIRANPSPHDYHYDFLGIIRFLNEDYQAALDAFFQNEDHLPDIIGWQVVTFHYTESYELAGALANKFVDLVKKSWDGSKDPNIENIQAWFKSVVVLKRQEDSARVINVLGEYLVKIKNLTLQG